MFLFYFLFGLERLKTEVEAVLGDKEEIEFEDLSKLEYMIAVRVLTYSNAPFPN